MCRQSLALCLTLLLMSTGAYAQDQSRELAELRQLLAEMKNEYENRITALESRLEQAEKATTRARRHADEAKEIAEDAAINASSGASAPNVYNPAIGAVLVARYAKIGSAWEDIPGFMPGGELGPGSSGVSLGESEVNLNSNVDSRFYANFTVALEDEGGETGVSLEEAWIQTIGLSHGLTLKGGRYFSGIGYLNGFHPHADDFADRPLPYQAFFGGQYSADGIQLSWVAPTALLLEFGAELNWGSNYPSTGAEGTSPDAWALFTKVGGDVGTSNSWQAGLSYLSANVVDRVAGADSFTGDSDVSGVDFVWKWAPAGNSTVRNFKLQGEYFRRNEKGMVSGIPYDGDQYGWYLQAVWQFMQNWRFGYRHDVANADNGPLLAGTALADPGRSASRDSIMIDWSPSEFSRLRLQMIDDRVLDRSDNQYLLQYLMSLGAHGAHQF